MDIKVDLLQWFIIFFYKQAAQSETLATRATRSKFAGSGIKNENLLNK